MILSKPMAEGVTNISRESGDPMEQDVNGVAESEMQD